MTIGRRSLLLGAATSFASVLTSGCGRVAPAEPHTASRPSDATSFYHSIGVNVHMYYSDTPYARTSEVADLLRELGIAHVRDGMALNRPDFYSAIVRLKAVGAATTLIMGSPGSDLEALFREAERSMPGAVEAIEGPNEYDRTGAGWQARLLPYQEQLFRRSRASSAFRNAPVVGASVGGIDLSHALDKGNIHPYSGGQPPEFGVERQVESAAKVSGEAPVWATECGYHGGQSSSDGQPPVTDIAQAAYLPRLFAENFSKGIERTFSYELVDQFRDPLQQNAQAHFGLIDYELKPKPQFVALKRLIGAVRPLTTGRGSPTQRTIQYSLSDSGNNLRHLLLSSSIGSVLLLWRSVEVNDNGDSEANDIRISLNRSSSARISPLSAGPNSTVVLQGDELNLRVDGYITAVELSA